MPFKRVAVLLLCVYLPLAWVDYLFAVARFASPADIASLMLASIIATLALALVLWSSIAGFVKLTAAVFTKLDQQRLATGILAIFVAAATGLALTKWLMGFGIPAPRLVTVPIITLACIGFGLSSRTVYIDALERITQNAWQIMRYPIALVVIASVVAAGFGLLHSGSDSGAASATSGGTRKSVLLVTIDTFSATRSNLYGAAETTTPFLQSFASEATVFDLAIASSNFTAPTVASVHTGQYPWTHRIAGQQGYFRAPPSTLASTLHNNGYRTAFFNANWWADPRHTRSQQGWLDMSGPYQAVPTPRWRTYCSMPACDTVRLAAVPPFAHLKDMYELGLRRFGLLETIHYPSEPIFNDARTWIAAHAQSDEPAFVWVHIFGPHDPYLSPQPFLYSILPSHELDTANELMSQQLYMFSHTSPEQVHKLEARYKEALKYADKNLEIFLKDPAVAEFAKRSVVVITADHGESFERNFLGHTGPLLTQSLIHVPLVIRAPGLPTGGRIAFPVSQTDIFPTILDLAGLALPTTADGVSLAPALGGAPYSERHIFSMNLEQVYAHSPLLDQPWSVALVDWPWKFVAYNKHPNQHAELYDLRDDPDESRNLAAQRPDLAQKYGRLIREALPANE